MSSLAGLRVGLVGPLPPPAGGMAMQTRQLAELLRGAGAEVTLVRINAPYRPAIAGAVPGLRALARLLPYLVALWRAAGQCDLFHVMANSGWSWHLFATPAVWIARLRSVPVIVNYRGGEAAGFLERSGRVVHFTMRRVARLVLPSGFLKQVFEAHGMAGVVVPNIVDVTRFRPADDGGARALAPTLLVARNLEPIYDNAGALRAFAVVHAVHPAARLVIAGSGPEAEALRRLADELGVAAAVRFAGRVDRDEMAALLRASSVVLNPSLVDNMPNSVLEALASGVPVVSTNVGGVPFIVADGVSALLVPPREPQAMAAAVLRLIADPALAARLAAAGLQEARRYTWERIAPQWAEAYRCALAAPVPGARAA
jgi:glycosyltransferase involved in cell wall biosynthesis